MVEKALNGIGMAYLGLSLTACNPERVVYGNGIIDLNKTSYEMHEIQLGDKFDELARKQGITPERLLGFNPGVEDPNHIEVGGVIFLPLRETPCEMYEIQSGDEFNQIAASYGVTPDRLHKFNPEIEDPHHIKAGNFIAIPLEDRLTSGNP